MTWADEQLARLREARPPDAHVLAAPIQDAVRDIAMDSARQGGRSMVRTTVDAQSIRIECSDNLRRPILSAIETLRPKLAEKARNEALRALERR